MTRRRSIGDYVVDGKVFDRRKGRSSVCDVIPTPDDSVYPLHATGDYEQFASQKMLAKILGYLTKQGSEYSVTEPMILSIQEHVKTDKYAKRYDLPVKFREQLRGRFGANHDTACRDYKLQSCVHYLSASMKHADTLSSEFGFYDHKSNAFVGDAHFDSDANTAMNKFRKALREVEKTKKSLVIPFESESFFSGHMCTMLVQPKSRGHATVHIFDPNGSVPPKEPEFPYCKNYRRAVESCVATLFSFQDVFAFTSVILREIPNFNMPGAAPRHEKTNLKAEDISRNFLSYQLDRGVHRLVYKREAGGICVIVALFVITMTICYGKRALTNAFWEKSFRSMSGSIIAKKYALDGIDLNRKIRGGDEVFHQIYCRIIYMRSFMWVLCEKTLTEQEYTAIGGKGAKKFYDKKMARLHDRDPRK